MTDQTITVNADARISLLSQGRHDPLARLYLDDYDGQTVVLRLTPAAIIGLRRKLNAHADLYHLEAPKGGAK